MTDRLTLLPKIYVPRSMGADELLRENSQPEFDALDPEFTLGVRYVADKYFPVLAEETALKLIPVSADIMRQVVTDKLWCEWRLERDGFAQEDSLFHRGHVCVIGGSVWFNNIEAKGIHTYTDLITLVRLAEG